MHRPAHRAPPAPLARSLAEWPAGAAPADILAGVAAALGAPWDGPGRPVPVVVPAGVPGWEVLDATREAVVAGDVAERRRLGAHHTPPALAARLVGLALDGLGPDSVVVYPAGGGGAFLVAAADALVARGADPRHVVADQLGGADLDPLAVAATRAALALWSGGAVAAGVVVADGLGPWQAAGSADAVVGNPPFRSPLAAGARAGRLAAYTDLAGRFLAASLPLVRPGGSVLLLQPESMLAARDAAPVRAAVLGSGRLDGLWVADEAVFGDADVRVCAPLVRVAGGPTALVRRWTGREVAEIEPVELEPSAPTWSHLRPEAPPAPRRPKRAAATVGDIATATAGFRDEFYGLSAAAREGGDGQPLVTSGLVDPGSVLWGRRAARIGGRRFERPTAALDDLDDRLAAWVRARLVPKVLVATQTRVLEAAADPDGRYVPLTPVVAVVPHDPGDIWRLAAALTSPEATAWALRHYGGTGMGRDTIRLSARQVLDVPLPADEAAWAVATAALRAGDVDACGAALADGAVLAWWRDHRP